ncbi:hypothetical protein H0H81_010977 [Sphagnurus paluster]|uniref:Uncharacterized protein n=1 Tax=Sphagnurus paluster TaxID=117069 RepID=A0A9P7FNW1_9AGAR|nr:hypothetical protein H0H81_010977 [Sphagnurus paluster]
MPRFSAVLTLVTLSLATVASAGNSCIAFDINWNMFALGFNGKDYNAGTQSNWASGTATDITAPGRPPFDNPNPTCYLSQFFNAIYVLGADSSNPSSIYIYDATAKSWSTQSVTTNGFNPTSYNAILDHDTNVFYAISQGEMYALDMGNLKAANSTPVGWVDVQNPQLGAGYQPVMALAQNHIHFLDVPGVAAGSAKIFVIHFSYMQPEPQSYGQFPATHGQATSFFMPDGQGVQQEFAFIPDDGSATYVINVETNDLSQTNTTQTLKGPAVPDPQATYFASTDSLVQLGSSGTVSFLPYKAGAVSVNSAATWSTVAILPVASPSSTTSGSTGNSSSSPSVPNNAGGAKGAAATGSSDNTTVNTNGALMLGASAGWSIGGLVAFAVAALFL